MSSKEELIEMVRTGGLPGPDKLLDAMLHLVRQIEESVLDDFVADVLLVLDEVGCAQHPQLLLCLLIGLAARNCGNLSPGHIDDILERLVHHAVKIIQASDLSLAMIACAQLRHRPRMDIATQFCSAATASLQKLREKDRAAKSSIAELVGTLVWALAIIVPPSEARKLMKPLFTFVRSPAQWRYQYLPRLLVAFAVVGSLTEISVAALKIKSWEIKGHLPKGQHEGYLARAFLTFPQIAKSLGRSQLCNSLQYRQSQLKKPHPHPEVVDEVASMLLELGVRSEVLEKHLKIELGLFKIDIALPSLALPYIHVCLAIVVTAQSGYCSNKPDEPTGLTILEWRMLAARGWLVLDVPVHQWQAKSTHGDKLAYLQTLLQAPFALASRSIRQPAHPFFGQHVDEFDLQMVVRGHEHPYMSRDQCLQEVALSFTPPSLAYTDFYDQWLSFWTAREQSVAARMSNPVEEYSEPYTQTAYIEEDNAGTSRPQAEGAQPSQIVSGSDQSSQRSSLQRSRGSTGSPSVYSIFSESSTLTRTINMMLEV